MYAAVSPSESVGGAAPAMPLYERSSGSARLTVAPAPGGGRVEEAYQRGAFRLRFPRISGSRIPEAVLINTAGGVTGGDRFDVAARVADGARAVLTTQAAEKVYRSIGGAAALDIRLEVGSGARLDWLPQETILFDRGRLRRTLRAEIAEGGALLVCEPVVLGRAAHGETVRSGLFRDSWRIRRGGRLVYADETRLDGAVHETVAGAAVLGGARAFASLLLVAPDAEERLDAVRAALADQPAEAGASAWNGMLAVRMAAPDGLSLRRSILRGLEALQVPLPRVWNG